MKNNDNINKKSIYKKIAISTLAIGLSVGIFALNMVKEDPNFSKYRSNYNSDLAYIKAGDDPDIEDTISMTDAAANKNSINGRVITISTAAELFEFSNKTNADNDFLGYTYKLIDNIDYDDIYDAENSNFGAFKPVGYTQGKEFSGVFDGDGYEIRNLTFAQPSGEKAYYAMFWNNTGTIEELGLVDPSLTITNPWDALSGNGGVAYLVGENTGTVSYCFVNDMVDTLNNEKSNTRGITAPGARVATLCVANKKNGTKVGSLTNNYVAVDTVINYQSASPSWAEIALDKDDGTTLSNCYYYNDAISYINGGSTYFKDTYSNLSSIPTSTYGLYKTKADLKTQLGSENWYTAASYGVYSSHVGIDFGIKRGIAYDSTTNVLSVASPKDFAYMYELFNTDDYMASNSAIYNITSDINLAKLPVKAYTYQKGIGATIEGTESDTRNSLTLVDNNTSKYPTIYNAKIMDNTRKATSTGVDCYGLFNYLTGTVKNINVYINDLASLDTVSTSSNVKGIGVLSGYIEKGYVDNVNVYADFESTTNIGEYHIGGITGILGGVGVIRNSSAAGSMDLQKVTSSMPGSDGYMNGIAIGGIVGYVEASLGHLNTCTSAVDITCGLGTATTYAIGGIVGAGYTTNYSYDVANNNTTVKVTDRTANLENDGTITVSGDKITYDNLYVAGVIGRHLGMTAQVENFNNSGAINVKTNGNNTYVTGVENADILTTSISNSGMTASELKGKNGKYLFYASSFTNGENITVTGSSNNLHYTNVLNINAKGEIESTIDGIFNLAYNEKYVNGAKKETALTAQSINMNLLNEFAPVLNVVGATSASKTFASTIYNLRDINYAPTANVGQNTTFRYTGVALGDYISYDDVRNEGNITITLANYTIDSGTKLYVSGIFDILNLGCTASNLYNGGNITVNEPNGSTATKTFDMYLAGICNQNLSENSSSDQNPLNAGFDDSLVGTMDSVINKGNITVSSYYLKKDVAINVNPSTKPYFVSNIYVGGITYMTKGIISSAFNLGNIDVAVYSTVACRYEAGGISCQMDGKNAQIRDAANNGDIYVIDLGGKVTTINSVVVVGGIVGRNNITNTNNSQVLAFSINYGTIIGFLARDNMTSTAYTNAHSVAAGIIGQGTCNIVNIVNYGNVYGKECIAGIMGIVRLSFYSDSYTSTIANTINYGQVRLIPPRNNSLVWATYNSIVGLENLLDLNDNLLFTHAGSICSIFDFGQRNNVKIRYLINLYNEVTVFASLNNPSVAPDISTFITVRGATDEFGGSTDKIKYAPLSAVHDELDNIGVFSQDFIFRKAIDGIGLDPNYITDSYISDFFQFVKFDKVNQNLLETIGWRTIAYSKAAEDLVKNVSALSVLVTRAGSNATDLLSDAFNSDTWLSSCDLDVLNSLISTALNDTELSSSITDILDYVLFDSTATSAYNQAIRTSIINKILDYYDKKDNVDYYEVLQTLLYDTLFAKVVSEDDTNYKAVKDKIKNVLQNSTNLETVLAEYINLLENDTTVISELFNGTTGPLYETQKINLINTLLTGYDEYSLESIYNALGLTKADEDSSLTYKLYLQNHQSEATNIYAHLIANNSLSSNANYLAWANNSLSKYDLASMLESSSASGTVDEFGNITNLTGYKYSPVTNNNEYNSIDSQLKTIRPFVSKDITSLNIAPTKDYRNLWNIIKGDSEIQSYISSKYFRTVTNPTKNQLESGIIAKATEYTNSYQTNDRTMSDYGMNYGYTSSDYGNQFYELKLDGTTKYYGGINYGYNDNKDNHYNYYGGNSFGNDYAIKTRFIYTPDNYVTYRTNFLGPYATKTGIVYDQKITNTAYFSSNAYNYKKGANLAAVDESNDTTRGTVPVFISLNEDLIRNKIASSGTNASSTLYLYYWNNHNGGGTGTDASSDYMWKHQNFVIHAPTNTTGFLYKNYNSGTYMCDYYNFDPTYVATQNNDYNTKTFLPLADGETKEVRMANETGSAHTYKDHYLTAYCSASMITGLYYTYSSWYDKDHSKQKCVSLLAKRDDSVAWNKVSGTAKVGYCGIHTTDYICYKIDDLVKLDGYKTKGFSASNPTNDEDETNIIGAIVEKLLTDNKKLVLQAIYRYSIDNDFTGSDATVLKLLLTSVTDTEYAYASVTSTIGDLVSMNYSGIQTIGTYLGTLDTRLTNYKDRLITSTATNITNFKNLLIRMLKYYSLKVSEYGIYNTYARDDINNFIYNYLSYLYSNNSTITASEIDAILQSASDTDLQKLEDLLTHITHTSLYFDYADGYVYNDIFSIYDATLYSNQYPNYASFYDTNYSRVLVGGENSEIDFYTGNFQYGYSLEVIYKGTISINDDTQVSNSVTSYTFNNLVRNSSYILFLAEGSEIYDIKLYNSSYSGISSELETCSNVTSPFATLDGTRQFSNTNFVLNGDQSNHTMQYGNYYSNLWRNGNRPTDSDMYLKIAKGSNVTYNSITVTFKALTYYQPETHNFTFYMLYNNDGSMATSDSYNSYDQLVNTYDNVTLTASTAYNGKGTTLYQYSYSYAIPAELINLLNTQDIYLTINLEKEATNDNSNGQFSINDLIITYNFDFVNNEDENYTSNVILNQNLFNPYYSNTIRSSYTITNENEYCGVDISGGSSLSQSLTFSADSPTTVSSTNTKKIDAALLFEPWYYPYVTYSSTLNSHLDFNTINFGGDSIKENFESGKYNISDVAKYISKDYIVEVEANNLHDYSNESFIEFYVTGTGDITIYDSEDSEIATISISTAQNTYEFYEYIIPSGNYKFALDNGLTLDYALAIPTNIGFDYRVSGAINTLKVVSGDDEKTLISLDYSRLSDPSNTGSSTPADSNINTIGDSNLTSFNGREGNTITYDNYSMFYEVYPYVRKTGTTLSEVELRENDVFETIITMMATIHQDSQNSNYYSIFKDSKFNKTNLIEVIKLLSIADNVGDNSAFKKLVNGLDSSYYKSLLLDFGAQAVKVNIAKKLYSISTTNNNIKKYIYATYLGNNYLDNNNLFTQSIMYSLLSIFNDGTNGAGYYQFITSNTTVDADKVTLLINYLSNGSNINIDGYGIFALSSSQGIGYGIFIPDNMDLSVLDVYYQKSTIKDSSNNDVVVLHLIPSVVDGVEQPKSNEWRGGYVLSSAVSGTVDYAFYHDMKQLILSISTDIFELDFNDNSIKSVDDQIDNENGVITYYLSQSALNSLSDSSVLKISNKRLANGAKIGTLSGTTVVESTTVSLSGAIIENNGATKHSITKNNAFTVYAEDINVYKNYKLVLLVGAVGFADTNGLTLAIDPATESGKVPASGGKLIATVTGIFPEGMDLEPFIHIIIDGVEYANTDEKTYWTLDPSVSNNGVVNSDGTGAVITLLIDKSLPGSDDITFKLDIFGVSETATFKKTKSSGNSIITAIYDGDLIFASTTQVTDIPFGRAFDYSELTDYTSPNFYLYKFEVSDNAKVVITATKSPITVGTGANARNTGRIQYVVTYKITSETGSAKTYTHKLQEKEYFATSNFANLYADGNVVLCLENVTHTDSETGASSSVTWDEATVEDRLAAWLELDEKTQRPYYLYDGTYTYSSAKDLFTGAQGSSLNDEIKLHVAFNRAKDREPQYRVKYNLTNFYTLGSNVVFSKNATLTSNTAVSETYAGLTVTVSNNDSVGKYTYVYTYKNTGTWVVEGVEESYERYYEFPELIVQKLASTDAMLKNLTFLDQAVTIGNTATVILPNQVLVPNATGDSEYYEGTPNPDADYNPNDLVNDQIYNNVFESSSRKIQVQRNGIKYGGGSDAKNIKDYFIIGTVSDADLTNYCPTFTIDSAAEIYKYTTLEKLKHYGESKQTGTDKTILTNHDDSNTMFIYVPFTNGDETEVLLVELTTTGKWTNVYRPEFDGTNANGKTTDNKNILVGTFDGSFGAKDAAGVAIPNTTYVVSSNKGATDSNPSLYMDYIGTPLTGHFWYISYVVFSEDKLADGNSEGNIRYYHISIIDLTNNIQFYVKVYAPSDVDWPDIYMTVSENIYDGETKTTKELSAFAEYSKTTYSGSRTDISGYKLYTLAYDLQSLPGGYFHFSVDIPYGYIAKSYTDMANQLENSDPHYEDEKDAFLPKTAIITQKVNLEIVISQGEAEDNSKWAVAISDVRKEDAKYSGLIPAGV